MKHLPHKTMQRRANDGQPSSQPDLREKLRRPLNSTLSFIMPVYERNKTVKAFSTEVVLVDIEKFSLMSAEDQVTAAVVANGELEKFLSISTGQSAIAIEEAVIGFVPTGDGFYVVLHPQLVGYGPILGLSLRALLLTASRRIGNLINGIQIGVHFGELSQFEDITERKNFVGPVMNSCARLLKAETSKAPAEFLPDNNFVFCSQSSIEHFTTRYLYYADDSHFKKMGVKISEWIELRDKHGLVHVGAFIEGSRHSAYNPPRPPDFEERVAEELKRFQ